MKLTASLTSLLKSLSLIKTRRGDLVAGTLGFSTSSGLLRHTVEIIDFSSLPLKEFLNENTHCPRRQTSEN